MKKNILVFFGLWLLISCGQNPPPKTSKPQPVRRPAGADAPTATPSQAAEMKAAQGLIDQGIENFNISQWGRAQFYFEQAAKLAPSYGLSYFWMARVSYEEGHVDQAFALLDKAALLLKSFPQWLETISSLKAQWR